MQTGRGRPWIWDSWKGRADTDYVPKNYLSGDFLRRPGDYKAWKTESGKRPSFGGVHYDGPADPWEEITVTLPSLDSGGASNRPKDPRPWDRLDFKTQAIRKRLSGG